MNGSGKRRMGNAIPRIVFVAVSLVLQLGWLLLTVLALNAYYPWIELITRVLCLAVILHLNSRPGAAAYKIPWIMLIMAMPVMGLSLYLMMAVFADLGSTGKRMKQLRPRIRGGLDCREDAVKELEERNLPGTGIARYLQEQAGCPLYADTRSRYFPEAAEALEEMKRDLEQARQFIFMEYFIVSGDSAFREIGEILIRKARQGVDVRLMYDDVGSVGYVNLLFARKLTEAGVRCQVFNPAMPVLNLFMNHRDHRKITVIDGRVGYTGGYNLADEYFGRKITYGRWKDTGIRLEGPAVDSLTAAFLEMWAACTRKEEPAEPFLRGANCSGGGFVQPYEDDPLGRERVAQSVYLNLIYSAKKSLYLMTPYLIITDEMISALTLAAKRGVDVRVVTPGIPDKKLVYAVTRSYYRGLAEGGVRIFEYSPGFCHAKQMLCDGAVASVGTSNLDYRSLYLHFENNAVLYGGQAVDAMARDFEEIFPQCREVTESCRSRRSGILALGQYFLRLFAPMM